MDKQYDIIVIGAGNGGLSAAASACSRGFKTLLIEKGLYAEEADGVAALSLSPHSMNSATSASRISGRKSVL